MIGVRLHAPTLAKLDQFIEAERDSPTRPEAIRRLLEKALA